MNITIHNVKRVGINPNQTLATISSPNILGGKQFGYFVALDKEDENSDIHKYILSEIKAGNISVEPLDDDLLDYKSSMIREQRNKLLDETDKYMTADYPITDELRNALKDYRQSLRNLPEQDGFPENVVWPEMPNTK